MVRSELAARLNARYPNLHRREAERIVKAVLDTISKALVDGRRVELRGFGVFRIRVRPGRIGRDPRNGKLVSIGEKRTPAFRIGKELRELMRGGQPAP